MVILRFIVVGIILSVLRGQMSANDGYNLATLVIAVFML